MDKRIEKKNGGRKNKTFPISINSSSKDFVEEIIYAGERIRIDFFLGGLFAVKGYLPMKFGYTVPIPIATWYARIRSCGLFLCPVYDIHEVQNYMIHAGATRVVLGMNQYLCSDGIKRLLVCEQDASGKFFLSAMSHEIVLPDEVFFFRGPLSQLFIEIEVLHASFMTDDL